MGKRALIKVLILIFGSIAFILVVNYFRVHFLNEQAIPIKKDIPATTVPAEKPISFGEPVYGDLNNDGFLDRARWQVDSSVGSGTFYYAVLDINNGDGTYKTTDSVFLGDRIAPQTLEIQDGRAVFNFAERRADEPMTAQPSIGKSVWINYDKNTGEVGEWVKGFEGESNLK